MRSRPTRPSVGGMNNKHLLRIGGAAAVLGVIVQLAAAMLEPGRDGDTDKAIRTIAESGAWTGRWLVHVTGIVLIVVAVAVVTRTFSEGPAKEWARCRPAAVRHRGRARSGRGAGRCKHEAPCGRVGRGGARREPGVPGRLRRRVERDRESRFRRAAHAGALSRDARGRDPGRQCLRALARLDLRGRRSAPARRDPPRAALARRDCPRPRGQRALLRRPDRPRTVDVATSIFACHARRRRPRASRLRPRSEENWNERAVRQARIEAAVDGRRRQLDRDRRRHAQAPRSRCSSPRVGAGTARRARLRTRVRGRRDRMPGRRVELHGSVAARQRRRRQRPARRP